METLTSYRDYEGVLMQLAGARNWSFTFRNELVPLPVVFNAAMYAPPLLFAAQDELQRRSVAAELGFRLEGDANSLYGAHAHFVETVSPVLSQFWRIVASAHILACLPVQDGKLQLDPLQFVLADQFAQFLPTPNFAEGRQ